MATKDKTAVTVYLSNEVLAYVEDYCNEFGVTGKNKHGELKPRLATGIHDLLKIMLNTPISELDAPLKKSTKSNVDSNVLEDIVKRLDKLESVLFPVRDDSNVLKNNASDSGIVVMDTDSKTIVNDSDIEVDDSIQSDTLPDNLSDIISDIATASIAPSESAILPVNVDLGDNLPHDEETGIKSYDEAVIEIKRLKEQGLGYSVIITILTGKYFTKQGKTNWSDTQIRRILKPSTK